jgi:predicted MFS family arabinose efflux permease
MGSIRFAAGRLGLERDIWLLSMTSALIASGFLGMAQLLKALYVLRLGLGAEYIGLLFAVGAGSYSLASIPAGFVGARWGARRTMLAGAMLNLSAMCLLPLTQVVPAPWRPLWLLMFQAIAPTGWALFSVNQVPAIMALTTVANRRAAYAVREATYGVGMFLGALIGGLLPDTFTHVTGVTTESPTPYTFALWVAVAVVALGLAPLSMVKSAPVVAAPRLTIGKRPPLAGIAVVALCGLLINAGLSSCRAFAPAYLDRVFGLSTSLIGVVTSIGLGLAVLAALASSRLFGRSNSMTGMVVGACSVGLCLLVVASVPLWTAAGLGVIGALAMMSVWMPSAQVVQMEAVGAEWRPLAAGVVSMASSMGFAGMSLAGGYIAAAAGYPRLFLVAAVLALLSGALSLWLARRRSAQERAA